MSTSSVTKKSVSTEAAYAAIQAATAKAAEMGIGVCVSVVDSSAIEVAFLRMNNAFIPSLDIAKNKAYTSAGFGFPTMQWDDVLKGNTQLQAGVVTQPRIITFGGGLPIYDGEELIGAIGVSGGSEEEDVLCAQAGLDSIFKD